MKWVVLFVIIVILFALKVDENLEGIRGDTLGETIFNSIGCLLLTALAMVVLAVFAGAASTA